MTRTGPTFTYGTGGNVARAQFCNRRGAKLMLRIHADGSASSSSRGISTLYPGSPPRLDGRHLRAEPACGAARPARDVVCYTRARPRSRPPLGPDRLQLGRRPRDPGRDGLHDEPDRAAPAAVERLPVEGRPRPHRRRRGVHSAALDPRRICSATCRPRSCTDRRRSPTSAGTVSAWSIGVSAASNSSRSSATTRASASFAFSASACGSGTTGAARDARARGRPRLRRRPRRRR